jgi:hypothetical protein
MGMNLGGWLAKFIKNINRFDWEKLIEELSAKRIN